MNWRLVAWLCVGSVPSAFLGVLLLRLLGDDSAVQQIIKVSLGVALLLAAALGHALFGDLKLDIAAAVLVGSVPGVLIGARISSRAPVAVVRTALVVVLLASALKLLNVSTPLAGAITGAAIVAAVAVTLAGKRRVRQESGIGAAEIEGSPEPVGAR